MVGFHAGAIRSMNRALIATVEYTTLPLNPSFGGPFTLMLRRAENDLVSPMPDGMDTALGPNDSADSREHSS